jgi:hypothetical protein
MDGILMKGVEPARPGIATEPQRMDERSQAVQKACEEQSRIATASAEKVAADLAAEAKSATDKEAAESDPAKKGALEKEAKDQTLVAKAAQENVDAAKQQSGASYTLKYFLDPDLAAKADTKDVWLRLLGRPWNNRAVTVSVGPTLTSAEAGSSWPSEATIEFRRINPWWLAVWAVIFVSAVILFVRYARSSDIIRDPGTLAAPAGGVAPQKSYSLARTQMALWTFLVAGALAFIFLVTWNENTVTAGVLVLIGISSGTTLLAAVADGTQPAPQPTKGFVADLLSDGDGPSFHRYQMMLFTVILALIFVVKTASGLVMPEFDSTLLGLMGISSGTYLGFKLQGK